MAGGGSPVSGLAARLRSLLRGLRRRGEVEAEMAEEMRFHIDMEAERLVRERGLPPAEAARRARIEFGHVESHKEDARASRGLRLFDEIGFSWLDVKLGLRMLAKYPGLSLVSVIGMSVAIAIGAGAFGAIESLLDPSLPLHEDERVVALQNADAERPGSPDRRLLHDFVAWRGELGSVEDLSAFTGAQRNLIVPGHGAEQVPVARMTASGFRVARVAPVLGRPLLEEDEREGAPPVVVIAHEEWQRLFGGDPGAVGRAVRLGAEEHTVVGVMPAGFRFPLKHRYWVPLRLDPAGYARGDGPELYVFGRLAGGVTREQAQAQLTLLGRRAAAEHPETHARLRPRVLPYAHDHLGLHTAGALWALRGVQGAVAVLLLLVAVNVAILVYARTATRAGEIAVRTALGASRRRIVTQHFAEALVMSALAAALGLAVAGAGLAAANGFVERVMVAELPFWLRFGASPALMAYVAGLALLAGVVVGVAPALRATGRDVQARLKQLGSGGSQMQLGRTWTVLVVAQVAVAVAGLPYALYVAAESVERGAAAPGYPAGEFIEAWLWYEREETPPADRAEAYEEALRARFRAGAAELVRRLEAEPAVAGVTVASGFPGGEGVGYAEVEVEGTGALRAVRVNRVETDFFDVLGIPVLAGRPFAAPDTAPSANAVVVDRRFAEAALAGGGVLGRRVRYLTPTRSGEVERGPWLEVVGVVPTVGAQADLYSVDPTLYQPVGPGRAEGVLAVRVRKGTPPAALVGRVRELTAAVDPALQLHELRTGAEAERVRRQGLLAVAVGVAAVTLSVLLLSAAGIYAMMAFTVAKRRREIGIRAALGAAPGRLLRSIFARVGAQLGGGALAGLALAVAADRAMGGGPLAHAGAVLLPAVAGLVLLIGLLAAIAPARRSLAVQPTEALRGE